MLTFARSFETVPDHAPRSRPDPLTANFSDRGAGFVAPPSLRVLLTAILLLLGASVAGELLALKSQPFMVIQPSAGVLLALLLLQPRTAWPWIFALGLGVAIGFSVCFQHIPPSQAIPDGVGVLLQAALGLALVRRTTGPRPPDLGRLRDFSSLIVAALLAPVAHAAVGALLAGFGKSNAPFETSFAVWWGAQAIGVLMGAPLVISWWAPVEPRRRYSVLTWLELAAAFAGLCFAAQVIFGGVARGNELNLTLPFFTLPFLFWIALRFRFRASAVATAALAVLAILQSPMGLGPLDADHGFILQVFLVVSILSSLLLASSLADRRRTESEILALNQILGERVDQRTSALTASERRFEALAEAAPVGIFSMGRDGICWYVNDRWCALTGQTGGQAIGQRWLDVIDPLDLPVIERKWDRSRLEDQAMDGEFRLRPTAENAEVRWVFAQIATDHSGAEKGSFIGTVIDISARKAAEAATEKSREELEERVRDRTTELSRALSQIRESEGRVRAVIDSASDAFIATDPDGRIVDWNPEAVETFGYSRTEVLGRPVTDVILSVDGGENVRPGFSQLFATGSSPLLRLPTDFLAQRANGQSFPAEMTISVAGDSASRVFSIFLRDITERKLAEDAVRESESVLRSFFDSTPMMMGLIELHSEDILHVSVNTAAARFYQLNPQEMAGRRASELGVPISVRQIWMSYYRDSHRLGIPQQFEYRADTPDGPRQLSVTVCYATHGPGGRLQFAYAAEDITERRLAAEDLREKTEALENAAEGVARIDSRGRIISVNRAFSDLTGFQGEDLVGEEWLCTTHPADRGSLKVAYQTMLAQGKAEQEVRGVRKDGTAFYQQQVMVSTYDQMGTFIGHYCFVRDITSRARAEAERDRFFTMSLDMLCIAGFNGYFRRLNPAFEKMLGFSIAELQAAPLYHFVHPEDRAQTEEQFQMMLDGCEAVAFENRFRCKDGTYRWFSWTATPFAEEQIIYAVAHDVTEQKRVAAEIIASLEEKDVLLKEIHHRVKNNLQVISSLLQLQSGYIKDRKTLETFRESQNRIRSMAMIHEKLYQTESLARIDFEEYATSLTSMLIRSYATTSGIRLQTNIEKVDLNLDTAVPIGLITNELLSNAMKYAFPDGREGIVTVALKQRGEGSYELTISDNGIGLPEDLQVEKAKSLGLRLVRILTGQIGGTLEFTSSGGGTIFTVNFSDV